MGGEAAAQTVLSRPGAVDGSWLWLIPDAPDGLQPTQSWHATGSAPSGNIFVGGMDHATNSALYRIRTKAGRLSYVGDARSAAQRAGNLLPGETFEKFHTRPTWFKGKVYVATMDYSKIDAGYLNERGSHLYAFAPATGTFSDLSATQPGGVSAPHLSVLTLAGDPARNILYQAAVPTGEILRYDMAKKKTVNLGRPSGFNVPYVYFGRFMWLDSRGRLYFSAGHSPAPVAYDPAIFNHIYYYDPVSGFGERTDWPLQATRAIETGQCLFGGAVCYVADDQSRIYRFTDRGPEWTYVGKVVADAEPVWVFDVTADGRKAYVIASPEAPGAVSSLYEYDLTAKTSRRLCAIADLDDALTGYDRHTGYNAWDQQGRFYFVSFPSERSPLFGKANARVTAVDPVRLKAALHLD
ncbi:MAG: hypothetical protein U1E42_04265 [Rhodospirillales bacterium]